MSRHFKFFLLIFFLGNSVAYSQIPYHYKFDVDNGMPSNEIYDIVSDSNNILWVSTDRGICKYNGYDIDILTANDGLGGNTNFSIYIDSENVFWLAGYNKTISNIHNDSVYIYELNEKLKSLKIEENFNWVNTFSTDSLGNRYFTIEKTEIPVLIREVNGQEFELVDPYLKHQPVYEINECNFLSRIGNDYIFFHEFDQKRFFNIHTSKALRIKNDLLLQGDSDLTLLDSNFKFVVSFDFKTRIHTTYIDDKNNIWVCTNEGLFIFNDIRSGKKPQKYFANTLVSCIYQDFEGNYWVGTNSQGLYLIPSFELNNNFDGKEILSKEKLVSIRKYKGALLIGNTKSELILYNKNGHTKKFKNNLARQRNHVFFYEENSILDTSIVNLDAGISFDGKIFKREPDELTPRQYVYSRRINLMNGDLVFVVTNGFEIFLPGELQTQFIKIGPNRVRRKLTCLAQDNKENVYFGTMNGIVKVENYDYNSAIEIKDSNGNSLKRISDIHVTPDCIWVTTVGDGVYILEGNEAISVSDKVDLSNLMINKSLVTQDSFLWLATNNGIDVLSYSNKDTLKVKYIRSLKNIDGLTSNYVNDLEYWNGHIWAATNNGICRFDPDIINRKVPQIPIYITNFESQDSTYNLDQELHFTYDQNDILISYSGLSFKQQNKQIQYKYRLIRNNDSDQSQWYYTDDRNQRFNDLPPGDYLFEVNAENALRIWNDKPASISFTIRPHFSQTLFFRISMSAFGLILIYIIYLSQVNRIKKQEQDEKALAEAKQKTQEAELAAIRNQMNPHFVYNSLNSIQNLIFKNDKEGANRYMSKFSKLMRQSLQFTRLDFIDLEKEIQFLTNYLDLEALRFPGKFKANFKVSKEIIASQVLIPSLILQPIVENSIKHGFNNISYKGIITIEADLVDSEYLQLTVSDNGNGSKSNSPYNNNPNTFHESIGTNLVKTRLELLNEAKFKGKASMEEFLKNEGYTTKIKIPLIFRAK